MTRSNALTLYSHILPSRLSIEIPVLLSFNLLLIASAYISINLPFSPVPITAQTFAVLVLGISLGRTRAVGITVAYLLEGAIGLPVFAGGAAGPGVFVGPTAGYLLAFPLASFVIGSMAEQGWDRSYFRSIAAMTCGTAIIFAGGLAWLSLFIPAKALLASGLIPFLPGAAIKTALAAVLLPTIWKLIK